MSSFTNMEISGKEILHDSLQINLITGRVKISARIFKYRDRDTHQIVYYIPSLEISGYGNTDQRAREMLNSSMDNYFTLLFKLPPGQLESELIKSGWKHTTSRKEEYSRAYVDVAGNLRELNAAADEIEALTIEV